MINTSLSSQVLKRGTYLGKDATVDLIHVAVDANEVDMELAIIGMGKNLDQNGLQGG